MKREAVVVDSSVLIDFEHGDLLDVAFSLLLDFRGHELICE